MTDEQTITLESLVGEHVLTGVDFGSAEKGEYDDHTPETCVFVLDGDTYTVTEDPDDGYRSAMRSIKKGGAPVVNTFPPCRVVGSIRTDGTYSSTDDVLELRDVRTGKIVLEVGTQDVDDYYPAYVARFDPTAMASNADGTERMKKEKQE